MLNNIFKNATVNAMKKLWNLRSGLNLLGNTFNIHTGKWLHADSGIGAGIDSFYEYLFKGYILLGNEELYSIYNQSVEAIRTYLKKNGWFLEANIISGKLSKYYVDSLQAFWPALQVIAGDLNEAIEVYDKFYGVWKKYGFIPEVYDVVSNRIISPSFFLIFKLRILFFKNLIFLTISRLST